MDATSASYPKTWLLHSVNEPTFPDTGSSFRIEHAGGRLDVWTLLPEDTTINAIGGSGKEYWVDGENYPPNETRDSEAGAWRVEVNPARESASDFSLHVLIASDAGRSQNLPQVKGSTRDGQTAIVEIADGTGKATLQFRAKGQTGGHISIAQKVGRSLTIRSQRTLYCPTEPRD